MNNRMRLSAVLLWSSVLLVGCADDAGPELGTVTGRVTMKGQPLENAKVLFWLGQGRASQGVTDANGDYELGFTVNQLGALPGTHTVRITTAILRPDDTTAPERVPAEFNKKSTLTQEVKPGANVCNFDIP